jgi:hypothetical protein
MENKVGISQVPQYGTAPIEAEPSGVPTRLQQPAGSVSAIGRLFGVYVDARTWGALFYMLISLVTGVVYFTWGVAGLSLALGFAILIIGVPFAILFLLSVRGLTALEARLVDALLGAQIPRVPFFRNQGQGWLGRLKALLTDRRTWRSLLYLVVQLPLGVIYFCLSVILLALALGFMAIPFAYVFGDPQILVISGQYMALRPWTLVAAEMARTVGQWHARYAKGLLAA